VDFANGGDECDYFGPIGCFEVFLGDGASSDTTCSQASIPNPNQQRKGGGGAPMVSRAELRPPPLLALIPYLAR
jgi:hypothetical protein